LKPTADTGVSELLTAGGVVWGGCCCGVDVRGVVEDAVWDDAPDGTFAVKNWPRPSPRGVVAPSDIVIQLPPVLGVRNCQKKTFGVTNYCVFVQTSIILLGFISKGKELHKNLDS